MRLRAKKIKDLDCPLSNYTASCNGDVANHIRGAHLDIKRLQCKECSCVARHHFNLKTHASTVHRKEGLMCKDCDIKFSMRSDFVNHINCVHLSLARLPKTNKDPPGANQE